MATEKDDSHKEGFAIGLELMYLRYGNVLREQFNFTMLRLDDNFKRLCLEHHIEIELDPRGGYRRREKN